MVILVPKRRANSMACSKIPTQRNREFPDPYQGKFSKNRETRAEQAQHFPTELNACAPWHDPRSRTPRPPAAQPHPPSADRSPGPPFPSAVTTSAMVHFLHYGPSDCQSEFPATKGLPSSFWASSSAVGSRPISLNICLDLHMMLLMVSIICTKMGIVGAWSAMLTWRITQVE
jgi:hypothetical protein